MTLYARKIHSRLMGGEPLDKSDHADHTHRAPKNVAMGKEFEIYKSPHVENGFHALGDIVGRVMVEVEKRYKESGEKCSR